MRNTRASEAIRNAQANIVAAALDGGYLRIYSGTQPDSPDDAPDGVLLAEMRFVSFDPASGGAATHGALASDQSATGGLATWYRAFTSAGVAVIDGTVGGSGTNIVLSQPNIMSGSIVTISSFTYSLPQSGE